MQLLDEDENIWEEFLVQIWTLHKKTQHISTKDAFINNFKSFFINTYLTFFPRRARTTYMFVDQHSDVLLVHVIKQ